MDVDTERQADTGVQTKDGVVIEMTDNSSNYSNHSRGANSEEFIIQRPRDQSRQDHAGRDGGVLVETSFASKVEYRQQEPKLELPWAQPQDRSIHISAGEQDR